MKTLFVGDAHVRESDVEEGVKLIDFVMNKAKEAEVNQIVFLGDQSHSHSILHVDVLKFWHDSFRKLSALHDKENIRTIALVGNHDISSTGSGNHSMLTYDFNGLCVVDAPTTINDTLYLPFYRSNEDFVNICKQYNDIKTVVCHQEFRGAKLNAGFSSPNGVEISSIPQKCIISGHIHMAHQLYSGDQTLIYVGSPRWLNMGDANIDKQLAVYEDNRLIASYDTSEVCSKIFCWTVTPTQPMDMVELQRKLPHRHTFDIKGPKDFVLEQKAKLQEYGKIRTFVDREETVKVKESDGIMSAFGSYLEKFNPPNKTSKEVLGKMVAERLG